MQDRDHDLLVHPVVGLGLPPAARRQSDPLAAGVVQPAQPFLDWLHKADPTSSNPGLADLGHASSIDLLPLTDSLDDADRLLRRCFDTIFTAELDGMLRDPFCWPTKRTYQMFRMWFECTYHSVLVDLDQADLFHD